MIVKKNLSIQLIRIIAMLMIFFDHILHNITFPMQSVLIQVSNSGVFIFLLISGYLYGNKNIANWKEWFKNRLLKICIPMWIFMAIDVVAEAILWDIFEWKYIFIYMFNLQGILGVNIGGTNLWFLTLIMICYLITPILQWIKNKNLGKAIGVAFLVVAIVMQIIFAHITDVGMVAGHTLSWCIIAVGIYIAGYFVGNYILSNNITIKNIGAITIMAVISAVIVLIFNHKFDGQIIYDKIIIFYGLVVIDFWICLVLYKIGKYIKSEKWIRVINHFDTISYEFYIVHGLLIAIFATTLIKNVGIFGYILVIIVLSYVAAWALHGVCSRIYKRIK